MDIIKNEKNKEDKWQIYDYTFLSDILEMLRGTCCIVHTDKQLNSLFTALIDYLDTCIQSSRVTEFL